MVLPPSACRPTTRTPFHPSDPPPSPACSPQKLDELMESAGPNEVPFQLGYQPQEVRQLLR